MTISFSLYRHIYFSTIYVLIEQGNREYVKHWLKVWTSVRSTVAIISHTSMTLRHRNLAKNCDLVPTWQQRGCMLQYRNSFKLVYQSSTLLRWQYLEDIKVVISACILLMNL